MTEKNQNQERRKYYRIDDSVIFNYRIVHENQHDPDLPKHQQDASAAFEMADLFGQINQQMRTTLGRIGERSADIAAYLKNLDRKIDLLVEMNLFKEHQSSLQSRRKINLGAGGLSFGTDEKLKQGTLLAIDMILSTALTCLHLTGRVIMVTKGTDNDYPYRISIGFTDISDIEEDQIIKHTLRLQSEQLRANKSK